VDSRPALKSAYRQNRLSELHKGKRTKAEFFPPLVNITGQRFGKLVARYKDGYLDNSGRSTSLMWMCMCDCGNTARVRSQSLRDGTTRSCGCLRKETPHPKSVDFTGKRVGKLTVVSRAGWIALNGETKRLVWNCVCDCGNEKQVRAQHLRDGKIRSCGCLAKNRKHPNFIDLTGQRFDRWTAMEFMYSGKHGARWRCICDCGEEKIVDGILLRKGVSKSCGCYAKDYQRERIKKEGWAKYPTISGAMNYVIEKDGEKHTIGEWAEKLDILPATLINRWSKGWSDEEILRPTKRQYEDKFAIVDPIPEEDREFVEWVRL
jgi:hypothetical protein